MCMLRMRLIVEFEIIVFLKLLRLSYNQVPKSSAQQLTVTTKSGQ